MNFCTLEGKIAVVTGGSRGIGKIIAMALKEAGAKVVIIGSNELTVKETAMELGVSFDMADFGQKEQVQELGARLIKNYPEGIDILVNNAGFSEDGLFVRQSDEQWSKVLQINLDSAVSLTRAFIPSMMKKRAGRIINITSVVGHTGNSGQTAYVASKAALTGFTKALAKEIARRGITVNAISPGFIETNMTQQLPEKVVADYKSSIPLQRFGQPEDIANTVRFLASDAAGYITGTTVHVNGGLYV